MVPIQRQIERASEGVRQRICPNCSRYRPGRTPAEVFDCQAGCDLFQRLPKLVEIACCRDSSLVDLDATLHRAIADALPPHDSRSPLARFRHQLVGWLKQAIRH